MSMQDARTNTPYLVGGATVREVHTATELTDTTTITQYYLYQYKNRIYKEANNLYKTKSLSCRVPGVDPKKIVSWFI